MLAPTRKRGMSGVSPRGAGVGATPPAAALDRPAPVPAPAPPSPEAVVPPASASMSAEGPPPARLSSPPQAKNMLSLFDLDPNASLGSFASASHESLGSLTSPAIPMGSGGRSVSPATTPLETGLSRKSSVVSYNPDGSPVVWARRRSRHTSIVQHAPEGEGSPQVVTPPQHVDPASVGSPDSVDSPRRRARSNTTMNGALGLAMTSEATPAATAPPTDSSPRLRMRQRGLSSVAVATPTEDGLGRPLRRGLSSQGVLRGATPPVGGAASPDFTLDPAGAGGLERKGSTDSGDAAAVAAKPRRKSIRRVRSLTLKQAAKPEEPSASSSLLPGGGVASPASPASGSDSGGGRPRPASPALSDGAAAAAVRGSVLDTINKHDKKFRERLTQKGLLQGLWENPRGRQVEIIGSEVTFKKNGKKDRLEDLPGGRVSLQGLTLTQASRDGKVVVWSDGEQWRQVEVETHGTYTPVELPLGA